MHEFAGWGEFPCSSSTDIAFSRRFVVELMCAKYAILSNGWAEGQQMRCMIILGRIKDGLHTCDV